MFKNTVYIDDMNLHYFNVDFLINQNINAEDLNYRVNDNTKLLLGSKYTMLRKEFRNAPKKVIKENVENILITVGGADPNNITGKILSYINNLDYKFHVVIGPSFNNINKLIKYEEENKNIKLHVNANMYQLMQNCDLAISACGSTLYELCSLGIPTIGVIIADNQIEIGNKLHNMNIINNLGWYEHVDKEKFSYELNKLIHHMNIRKKMSNLGRRLIDGKGVARAADILRKQ